MSNLNSNIMAWTFYLFDEMLTNIDLYFKRWRKPKGKSRMDNAETRTTLGESKGQSGIDNLEKHATVSATLTCGF